MILATGINFCNEVGFFFFYFFDKDPKSEIYLFLCFFFFGLSINGMRSASGKYIFPS